MKTPPPSHPVESSSPKYPLQKEKMAAVMVLLRKRNLIKSQKQLATDVFGVDDQTFSNWATGNTKLSLLAKKTFAYDFAIPVSWWDRRGVLLESVMGKQKDIPVEDATGKGLGKGSEPLFNPPAMDVDPEVARLLGELRQALRGKK